MHITEVGVSPLGAVMAFLYSGYIVLNAVLSTLLGRVIDRDYRTNDNIFTALTQVGGIQFSVGAVIIFASTFIPRGALALNPGEEGDLKTPKDDNVHVHADIESELPREGVDSLGKSQDKLQGQGQDGDDDLAKDVHFGGKQQWF
jgi:hypothetical protein